MSCDHWADGDPCPCYAEVERLRATLREVMSMSRRRGVTHEQVRAYAEHAALQGGGA